MLLYTYISRFSVNPHYISRGRKSGKAAVINFIPQPLFIAFFNFSRKRSTFAFTGEGVHTLGPAQRIAHNGTHGETRGVLDGGWYHYPRSVLRGSETLRGRVSERQTLPLLGLGREVLSKNAESLRDSDALMRVAVPRRRGPVWLRDPVSALLKFSSSNINGFGAPINIENLIFSLSLRRQNCSHF